MRTLVLALLLLTFTSQVTAQFSDPIYIKPHLDGVSQILATDLNEDLHPDVLGVAIDNDRLFWTPYLPAESSFTDPIIIDIGLYKPDAIWSQDVTSDGLADIVMVDNTIGELLWLANQSNGDSFSEPTLIDDQWNQVAMLQEMHLDGDANPDLLLVDNQVGTLAWYSNPGDGLWGESEILFTDLGTVTAVHVADLDDDGLLDLIIGQNNAEIYWYRRTGTGAEFAAPLLIADLAGTATSLGAAKLNNDDYVDLAVTTSSDRIYVLYQTADAGVFGSPEQLGITLDADNVLLVDMDQDDDIDIFLTGQVLSQNVYYRNDDGVFDEWNINYGDHYPSELLIVDFNLDEYPDIVAAGELINNLFYFANRATGFFQFDFSRIFQYGTGRPEVIQVADMNNDDWPDLVTNHSASSVIIQENVNGYGQASPGELIALNSGLVRGLQVGDLDQNGLQDVVFANFNHIYYSKQIAPGEFGDREFLVPAIGFGSDPWSIRLVDINNDDYPDLVYSSDGAIYVVSNDGTGNFMEPILVDVENFGRAIVYLADLDQDEDLDIVASFGGATGGGVNWYENLDDNGTFGDRIVIDVESEADVVQPADIDGDGDLDILTVDNELLIYRNDGNGEFGESELLIDDVDEAITGDINNDGWMDIVFRDQSQLFLSLSQNGTLGTPWQFGPTDIFYGRLHLADIDGDGDQDLFSSSTSFLVWFENFLIDNNPQLSIRVFWDENENAVYDTSEYTLSGQGVDLQPDGISSWTSADGQIIQRINPGDYQLSLLEDQNWQVTTESTYAIVATEDEPSLQREFGVTNTTDVLTGMVDITSGPTRCGFTVPFWFNVANEGTVISSGLASITLDPGTEFISAIPAPDSISGNQYFWRFAELIPTQQNQVYLEL